MKVTADLIKEKLIYDSATGKPVKDVIVENGHIRIVKESGETVEIPSNSIRGKHILMRLETGISEITEPIYV